MSGAPSVEAGSSPGFSLLLFLCPPFILHNCHQNLLPKTWVQSCHSPAPQPLAVICSLGDSPPSILSRPFPPPCPPPGSVPSSPVQEGLPGPPLPPTPTAPARPHKARVTFHILRGLSTISLHLFLPASGPVHTPSLVVNIHLPRLQHFSWGRASLDA